MSAGARLVALAGRLEELPGLLGIAKLANVGLSMAWGFVVTFVFVRLLPLEEFRSFVLLAALGNFTVSAELGLSAIAYSRLRRDRVGGEGRFKPEEVVALVWLMLGLSVAGALLVAMAIGAGLIPTRHPVLFVTFYGVSALNLLALLAKRVLAARDHNLWWESLDCLRRIINIALLIAALLGMPIFDSVLLQFVVSLALICIGLATVHASLAMRLRQWLSARQGAAQLRAHYLRDFGRTGALTLFDVAAYNAPYFTLTIATHDPRPLLLFDFLFKISRALSSVIRALVETMLPRLTRLWFEGSAEAFRGGLRRCLGLAMGLALLAAIALALLGKTVAHIVFDGNLDLHYVEIAMIDLLLLGLVMMCVSVYLQTGLGRFGALVAPSFVFLMGSVASVPLALAVGGPFSICFAIFFALVHVGMGLFHTRMLARLGHQVPQP